MRGVIGAAYGDAGGDASSTTSSACSTRTRRRSGSRTTARRPSSACQRGGRAGAARRARCAGAPGRPSSCCCTAAAQNAHTWDTVALALGPAARRDRPPRPRPLGLARRPARTGRPRTRARSRPRSASSRRTPSAVVGMSLGGLTALALASRRRRSWCAGSCSSTSRPGVDQDKASAVISFIAGPESFASFDEILDRTVTFNPTRSVSSLRRGILHNAHERPGRHVGLALRPVRAPRGRPTMPDFGDLWDYVDAVRRPVAARARRRLPRRRRRGRRRAAAPPARARASRSSRQAGHSVQGDQPLELARAGRRVPRRDMTT